MGKITNGDALLSAGFEYAGKSTQPEGEAKVALPAERPTLSRLNADGTDPELPFTAGRETRAFMLDFSNAEFPSC